MKFRPSNACPQCVCSPANTEVTSKAVYPDMGYDPDSVRWRKAIALIAGEPITFGYYAPNRSVKHYFKIRWGMRCKECSFEWDET